MISLRTTIPSIASLSVHQPSPKRQSRAIAGGYLRKKQLKAAAEQYSDYIYALPKTRDYQIPQTAGGEYPKYAFNRLCLRIGQKQGSPPPPAGIARCRCPGRAIPPPPPRPPGMRLLTRAARGLPQRRRGAAAQRPAGAAPGSAPRLSPPAAPRGEPRTPAAAPLRLSGRRAAAARSESIPRPGGQSPPAPPRPTSSARSGAPQPWGKETPYRREESARLSPGHGYLRGTAAGRRRGGGSGLLQRHPQPAPCPHTGTRRLRATRPPARCARRAPPPHRTHVHRTYTPGGNRKLPLWARPVAPALAGQAPPPPFLTAPVRPPPPARGEVRAPAAPFLPPRQTYRARPPAELSAAPWLSPADGFSHRL